jgi:AraC family transcriptional activator of pobA
VFLDVFWKVTVSDRRVATLTARRAVSGAPAVEVIAFDASHARVLLGDLELMFYAAGEGVDRLGEFEFDVRTGDLLLVTPGIVHDASGLRTARGWAVEFGAHAAAPGHGHAAGGDSITRLWWSNPLLAPFVAARQGPTYARFHVPAERRLRWVTRFAEMEREQAERAEGWSEVITAYLRVILIELARLAAPHTAGLRQQGETLLARVFDVIDERYRDPLSTANVAAAVGLSPGYLTTLVRQKTGRTVLDWILERRMAAARHLLLTTDLAAEAIAQRVGFTDPAYFNRRFRRYHGVSPGRWRAAALAGAVTPVRGGTG